MSAIDDIRKLLQDLVTPDLKALEARVTALDHHIDGLGHRIDGLGHRIDGLGHRIDGLGHRIDGLDHRIDGLDKKIDAQGVAIDRKFEVQGVAIDKKLDLTRDVLIAEIQAMKASMETNIAKLTHSLDLERRMARIEERSAMRELDKAS